MKITKSKFRKILREECLKLLREQSYAQQGDMSVAWQAAQKKVKQGQTASDLASYGFKPGEKEQLSDIERLNLQTAEEEGSKGLDPVTKSSTWKGSPGQTQEDYDYAAQGPESFKKLIFKRLWNEIPAFQKHFKSGYEKGQWKGKESEMIGEFWDAMVDASVPDELGGHAARQDLTYALGAEGDAKKASQAMKNVIGDKNIELISKGLPGMQMKRHDIHTAPGRDIRQGPKQKTPAGGWLPGESPPEELGGGIEVGGRRLAESKSKKSKK